MVVNVNRDKTLHDDDDDDDTRAFSVIASEFFLHILLPGANPLPPATPLLNDVVECSAFYTTLSAMGMHCCKQGQRAACI